MARLAVRVTPRGGRDTVDGWTSDETGRPLLKVRVSAAASDGAANASLLVLIAKALRVPRSAVHIVAGETSRVKRLDIDGLDDIDIENAFGER